MGDGDVPGVEAASLDAFYKCFDPLANVFRITEVFPAAYDQAMDAYKQEEIFYTIRSDKDTHFNDAIEVESKEDENLTGLASNKIIIKRVKIQSNERLNWDHTIWKTDGFDDIDLDLDSYCGFTSFLREDARRQTVAAGVPNNQWYYDSGVNCIPYEDLDGTFELHNSINNRDNVAKTNFAGGGRLITEIEYSPAA